MRIGFGIFTWDGRERRTDRYGAVMLASENYDRTARCSASADQQALQRMTGQRVRLWARVRESRESGHVGDLFLNIFPSRPEVNEEVVLGVGILRTLPSSYSVLHVALEPRDGRQIFWIDPHKLYRLHDQTVELHCEETQADFTPAPDVKPAAEGSIAVDSQDIQCKGPLPTRILSDVESFGGGLFRLSLPEMARGRKLKTDKDS